MTPSLCSRNWILNRKQHIMSQIRNIIIVDFTYRYRTVYVQANKLSCTNTHDCDYNHIYHIYIYLSYKKYLCFANFGKALGALKELLCLCWPIDVMTSVRGMTAAPRTFSLPTWGRSWLRWLLFQGYQVVDDRCSPLVDFFCQRTDPVRGVWSCVTMCYFYDLFWCS